MSHHDPTLGFLLHDVARLARKRFEQRARNAGLGLTRSQWQVLARLARCEGIQQGMLAETLELEPITLGRIIDKLETLDLVERRPHPSDRRIWQLYPKPHAKPLLERMKTIGEATRGEALDGLPEDDRSRLMEVLALMRANLIEATAQPQPQREARRG